MHNSIQELVPVPQNPIAPEFNSVDFFYLSQWMALNRNTCLYCGRHLKGIPSNKDHVVPRASYKEASNLFKVRIAVINKASSCKACNTAKGCTPPVAYVQKLIQQQQQQLTVFNPHLHQHLHQLIKL